MDDVYVYIVPLPPCIRELVTPCLDGYTVYIADRLDRESMIKAYKHALAHIKNGDFERSSEDLNAIEAAAHAKEDSDVVADP